ACAAADLSVDEVLQNYTNLRNRRITFIGLAEVEGADFYVWDLRDKHHKDLKRTVSIWWNMRLPNYPPGTTSLITHTSIFGECGSAAVSIPGSMGDGAIFLSESFSTKLKRCGAIAKDNSSRMLECFTTARPTPLIYGSTAVGD